ncbi:unnamed protein product [Ectocarpus sp. CCAP 1310/34]|nr:unnamed protein product [Ectocarpus sp. CCAP 1310/34]
MKHQGTGGLRVQFGEAAVESSCGCCRRMVE